MLLLDEPSAGLSPLAAERLFDSIIAEINRSGLSIALVEQNASEALAYPIAPISWSTARTAAPGDAQALAADPEIRRIFLGGVIRANALRGLNESRSTCSM